MIQKIIFTLVTLCLSHGAFAEQADIKCLTTGDGLYHVQGAVNTDGKIQFSVQFRKTGKTVFKGFMTTLVQKAKTSGCLYGLVDQIDGRKTTIVLNDAVDVDDADYVYLNGALTSVNGQPVEFNSIYCRIPKSLQKSLKEQCESNR